MWIVSQIGAREHYAIPRALHQAGVLAALLTDFWVRPGSVLSRLPGGRRLRDRYHGDLSDARVIAPNFRMLGFEVSQRLRSAPAWDTIIARNRHYETLAVRHLSGLGRANTVPGLSITEKGGNPDGEGEPTLFSYSYAARDLFRFAKERGWKTVLGQIDPGPEEERIVAAEHIRYPHLKSSWQPAPTSYWDRWREEISLADRIIVNSEWSRQCLLKEAVPDEMIETIPLVYAPPLSQERSEPVEVPRAEPDRPTRILFLGQINLRKGIGRLLDAMRLLREEPIELMLAGPCEIDPSAWADLPKVQYVGTVPRSLVSTRYREADLFILPTLSDGYALTQLEALSHGLPVIVSRFCGEAVVSGRNGWVLDALEPSDIAAGLRQAAGELRAVHGTVGPPSSQGFGLDSLANALLK